MRVNIMIKQISKIISTVFCIGKIKYAPGTFGSLPAFPICYIIMYFSLNSKIVLPLENFTFAEQQIITLLVVELLAMLFIFIVGTYAISIYIKGSDDQDPKEVVIDEVAGQMLTIILSAFSVVIVQQSSFASKIDAIYIDWLFLFILPFVLFRLFDIIKPWPINWCDKNIKGAFGVMFDDLVAALFAVVAQYVIVFLI